MCMVNFIHHDIQVYLKKKWNIMQKVNTFCLSFQKVKPISYRFITQSEIFEAFISWNFDDYVLQIMKT